MELDDLKSTWKSIEPQISEAARKEERNQKPRKHKTVVEELLSRFLLDIAALCIGCALMATSHSWAPAKMPAWWLLAVCLLMVITAIATALLYRKVRRIDLAVSTHTEVVSVMVTVRRFYNCLELLSCGAIALLIMAMAVIPPFKGHVVSIIMIYTIASIAFILEYIWYRGNIRKINRIANWIE